MHRAAGRGAKRFFMICEIRIPLYQVCHEGYSVTPGQVNLNPNTCDDVPLPVHAVFPLQYTESTDTLFYLFEQSNMSLLVAISCKSEYRTCPIMAAFSSPRPFLALSLLLLMVTARVADGQSLSITPGSIALSVRSGEAVTTPVTLSNPTSSQINWRLL